MGGVVQRLIFWNVGLFVVPTILFAVLSLSKVYLTSFDWNISYGYDWFSLSSSPELLVWKPWSLFTYTFLHGGVMHLFFNMLMLVFAGRLFLTFFTQKQFFGLYALAGIFAGLFYILSYNVFPGLVGQRSWIVGASASIMGVLIASAVYAPYYQVRLLLIGTVKLWHVAAVLVALDLIYAAADNTGGHLAHIGGALFGYLYIVLLRRGTDLSKGVSVVLVFFANLFAPRKSAPFKKVHKNPQAQQRNNTKPKDMTQKQIDEILDKISKSGYDSLTREEKDFLFKVGK